MACGILALLPVIFKVIFSNLFLEINSTSLVFPLKCGL